MADCYPEIEPSEHGMLDVGDGQRGRARLRHHDVPSGHPWFYHGVGRFFPEQWARFRAGVPEPARDGALVAAYYHLLHDPDPGVREQAARDWLDWEDAVVSLEEGHQRHCRYQDPSVRMAFARIVTHQ